MLTFMPTNQYQPSNIWKSLVTQITASTLPRNVSFIGHAYSLLPSIDKCAPMAYYLKTLGKMQRRAAIWILGAFKMSPSYCIEAIVGLIPINLHLQKLGGRSQLHASKLPPSYLICSLIKSRLNSNPCLNTVTLNSLTNRQCSLVKVL